MEQRIIYDLIFESFLQEQHEVIPTLCDHFQKEILQLNDNQLEELTEHIALQLFEKRKELALCVRKYISACKDKPANLRAEFDTLKNFEIIRKE